MGIVRFLTCNFHGIWLFLYQLEGDKYGFSDDGR